MTHTYPSVSKSSSLRTCLFVFSFFFFFLSFVTLPSPGQHVLWYAFAEFYNVGSDIMAQQNMQKCNKVSIMHNEQLHVWQVRWLCCICPTFWLLFLLFADKAQSTKIYSFLLVDYYHYFNFLDFFFYITICWWSFIGVWITASLLMFPGLFSVL